MTPEKWARIEQVFHEVSAASGDERRALLERACGSDFELRANVETLLRAPPADANFLETALPAAVAARVDVDGSPWRNLRVGAYQLEQLVGRGGMGLVFRARRADGQFKKNVAVKMIRWSLNAEDGVRRFQAERQVLARLDHPNIARLLDGGVLETGAPYLVMEYVDGQPIDRYCDACARSIPQRLELFRNVCAAVQFAHAQLVVHRDIKPGNILVDPHGAVKLLDFGIAKVLDSDVAPPGGTLTQPGARPMTPEYASPEQIRGEPVTALTDVYALGVVLYELLTGQRPHTPRDGSLRELERVICEEEPPPPSTAPRRMTASGRAGGSRQRRVLSAVRSWRLGRLDRDLDTIVLTALQKDPARRYGSVEQLSEDLRRFLEGRPILARPSTLRYRMAKFLGRNRLATSLSALAVLSLLGWAVTATSQAGRIDRERKAALAAQAAAEAAATEARISSEETDAAFSYVANALLSGAPDLADKPRMTVSEMLDVADREAADLSARPRVEARVRAAIGASFASLGRYEDSKRNWRRVVECRRMAFGPDHTETVKAQVRLAMVLLNTAELDEAEQLFVEALASQERAPNTPDADIARTIYHLGQTAGRKGDYRNAEKWYRRALEFVQRRLTEDRAKINYCHSALADALQRQGRYVEAEPLMHAALEAVRAELGPDDPELIPDYNNYAMLLYKLGRVEEVRPYFDEALRIQIAVFGEEHPHTGYLLGNIGEALRRSGDIAGADELLRRSLRVLQVTMGAEHPDTAFAMGGVARVLVDQGRFGEAEVLLRRGLAAYRQSLGEHPEMTELIDSLADLAQRRGDYVAAERYMCEGMDIVCRSQGEMHPDVSEYLLQLADVILKQARPDEAVAMTAEVIPICEAAFGPEHEYTIRAMRRRAEVIIEAQRAGEAESLIRAALARATAAGAGGETIASLRSLLGHCFTRLGRHAAAEQELEGALATLEADPDETSSAQRRTVERLAELYEAWARPDEAAIWRRELAEMDNTLPVVEGRAPSP